MKKPNSSSSSLRKGHPKRKGFCPPKQGLKNGGFMRPYFWRGYVRGVGLVGG